MTLGKDFKAPKQSDVAAWRALEGTVRVGHQFHTCGCDGPGFIPTSAAEHRRYLKQRLETYRNRHDAAAALPIGNERLSQAAFWADRVALVEAELAKL